MTIQRLSWHGLQAELTRRGEALGTTESERAVLAKERDELARAAKAIEAGDRFHGGCFRPLLDRYAAAPASRSA